MELDLNTFLTTVYCIVDDLYQAHFARRKPVRRGPKPELSDSEVLTLALLAQWQPRRSEMAFVDYAVQHWRSYFPQLGSRSEFNRRVRDVWGVLCELGPAIYQLTEQLLGVASAYQVLDCVPVPLMRRCRGDRHRSFGYEAAIGHGGSDDEWYYGVKLLGAVSPWGGLSGFVIAPANTDDRWVAEALLRWRCQPGAPAPSLTELAPILGPSHRRGGRRRGPTGPLWPRQGVGQDPQAPYLADMGFQGATWMAHWFQDYSAAVLTKADYGSVPKGAGCHRVRAWFSGRRQEVETAFQGLTENFGLKFPRARCCGGLLARLAAKVAAFNLAIHINHLFARPTFAFFNPLT